jgi:two-component system sensor histidine kinase/response regulator
MLAKLGHAVVLAIDGKAALAKLANQAFDLVLMDVQMPEMDGLEATAAVRSAEQVSGDHIPIIALTAFAMKGDRERFLVAGFDAWVPKPIQSADLALAIASVLSASAGRPSSASGASPRSPDSAQPRDLPLCVEPDGGDIAVATEFVARLRNADK